MPELSGCEHQRLAFAEHGTLLRCAYCGGLWLAVARDAGALGPLKVDAGREGSGDRVDMAFVRGGE